MMLIIMGMTPAGRPSITIQGADDLSSIQTNGFSSVKQAAQMDVCAMRDKSFRLAVKNNNDIDIYYSDDGLSWSLFAEKSSLVLLAGGLTLGVCVLPLVGTL